MTKRKPYGSRLLTYKNKTLPLSEWAKRTGINLGTLNSRYSAGWDAERILTELTIYQTREILLKKIYNYILEHKEKNDGNSPTVREIAENVGTTWSNIYEAMKQLKEVGLIQSYDNKSRSIIVKGSKWIPPKETKNGRKK